MLPSFLYYFDQWSETELLLLFFCQLLLLLRGAALNFRDKRIKKVEQEESVKTEKRAAEGSERDAAVKRCTGHKSARLSSHKDRIPFFTLDYFNRNEK